MSTIGEHIKRIYEDGELAPTVTVRRVRTVQREGERDVTREVELYNLDNVGEGRRAEYGARIVSAVGRQLEGRHGRGFGEKSLRRMLRFAQAFLEAEIVSARVLGPGPRRPARNTEAAPHAGKKGAMSTLVIRLRVVQQAVGQLPREADDIANLAFVGAKGPCRGEAFRCDR